uniref:Uncharacterized protein n=1 Tax=Glossina palpalis gambiensis TaxID=67801 RepID=A0A1B0ALH6_9MUSC
MHRLNLYILVFCAAEYSRNVVALNKTSMDIFSFREGLLPLFEWLKGHSCITAPSNDMIINQCHYNDDDDLAGI